MLSRVADSLFWISRYIERAEPSEIPALIVAHCAILNSDVKLAKFLDFREEIVRIVEHFCFNIFLVKPVIKFVDKKPHFQSDCFSYATGIFTGD